MYMSLFIRPIQISIVLIALVWFSNAASGQNLVPNPSFETYTSCPNAVSMISLASPWVAPSMGSPDYFNSCSSSVAVDVPYNFPGYQYPLVGEGYAGCYTRAVSALPQYREYIQAELTAPLEAGKCYHVGFFINLSNEGCATQHFGAYLSETAPYNPGGVGYFDVIPQIDSPGGYLKDTLNWVEISGFFNAQGGEQYITIGNFFSDAQTPLDPACGNPPSFSYYYIDSVYVIYEDVTEILDVDLGGPFDICDQYLIDPQIPNVIYTWEDGSHNETFFVDASGTYSLTVSDGCAFGEDSVEVEIIGSDPVMIGSPTVELCEGDSYTVNLDPNAGDYSWSNGSMDNELEITTSGTYVVSLDDGCDLTTDQITVNFISPPVAFDIGPDTIICSGDNVFISLPPNSGNSIEWQDGSSSTDYTIDSPGSYSVTISNACGEESDEIEVSYIDPLNITLGTDEIFLCEGEVYDLILEPDLGAYLWQDGSNDFTYTVTGPGNYSVTVTNQCESANTTIDVFYDEPLLADLGPDQSLCSDQFPFLLATTPVDHANYLWQDGSTETQFMVTQPGAFSLTITNSCGSSSDGVVINAGGAPVVTLPPDQMLCEGQILALDAGVQSGTYAWQDGSDNQTFLVTQPGTYFVTVTTVCGSGVDTIIVDYLPDVVAPDLGPDINLCPGETTVLYANTPGANYIWQNGSLADSFFVTFPGVYWVEVANMCSLASDTIVVNSNGSPPTVDLPSSAILCQGDTIVVTANVSGVQYLWSDGSVEPDITVTQPGQYSVTITNACGMDMDTVDIVDGGSLPVVSLGPDISLCPGDNVVITPSSSNVDQWLWQDGSVDPTYTVTSPGTVILQALNSCGESIDTLLVSPLPAIPSLYLGPDTSLCPGESISLLIPFPAVDILWSDGSSLPQLDVDDAGLVYATISNACGTSSDTMEIVSLPAIPILILGQDQSLCPGESFVLDPGIPDVQYLWQDGSTSATFTVTQDGTYYLSISNACGISADTIVVIESSDGPQLNLGPDVLACEGDVITIMSDISGVNYQWQDGSTLSTFSTSVSGTFILNVSNLCGFDADTVVVDIQGQLPATDLGHDTLLCDGVTLALSSTADAETFVLWQDGSQGPNYTVTSAGLYTVSESNHCGVHADSIEVQYLSPPDPFELGPDTILCPGESILLRAPITQDNIEWQDGSHETTFLADKEQTYSLRVSNDCGASSDELVLQFDNRIPLLDLDPTYTLCPGEKIDLDVTQPFDATYFWNTGALTPMLHLADTGTYNVLIETLCASVFDETILQLTDSCFESHNIYIPNIFSPNGDGINDFFAVYVNPELELLSMETTIYDRWGNQPFHSDDIGAQWNGDFNGVAMNPAVFVYRIVIQYKYTNSVQTEILSGDVTLVR